MNPIILQATHSDLPHVRMLLERHGLPTDGLQDRVGTTLVARWEDRIVGTAALEVYGEAGFLRSVAVDEALHGNGIGHRLTQALLERAREHGVRHLYLLTEAAADFFPRLGFQPIARGDVSPEVQQSVEFTGACPASALAMVRSLAG